MVDAECVCQLIVKVTTVKAIFHRSVDVSHFEIASVSTGTAENESKWKKIWYKQLLINFNPVLQVNKAIPQCNKM